MKRESQKKIDKETKSSIYLLLDLLKYVNKKDKKKLFPMSFLLLLAGLCESLNILLLLPFIAAISNPGDLLGNPVVEYIGITNQNYLVIFTLLTFLIGLAFSTFIRVFTIYEVNKTCANITKNISKNILRILLNENYEFFINNNSADLIFTLVAHTNSVTRCIRSLSNTLINVVLFIIILSGLIIYNPIITLIMILTTLSAYVSGAKFTKRIIYKASEQNSIFGQKQLKLLRETFAGIRDTLLNRDYEYRIKKYSKNDNKLKEAEIIEATVGEMPNVITESIFLLTVCFLMILVYLIFKDKNAVLTLGTFLLGAIKILSAMKRGYTDLNTFRAKRTSIIKLINIFKREDKSKYFEINKYSDIKKTFISSIKFKNVFFKYENSNQKQILKDINLEIKKNSKVGIIGKTGSGKTTLINLLVGLLVPSKGEITIDSDNINLPNNKLQKLNWMKNIAYVPQNIHLHDASILENIALQDVDKVNLERIEICSKISKIDEFVKKKDNLYRTIVGEEGVKLSGGQKQRLGIARALYKNADLLILDEATSALDINTEQEIIDNIFSFYKNITIIMITHRLNSLNKFDLVINLEDGGLKNN